MQPIEFIKGVFNKNKDNKEYSTDTGLFNKIVKKIGYAFKGLGGRDSFDAPQFDLAEIEEAYNTDSYIRQALDKYIELMFKQGWKITYKNKYIKKYLSRRFTMLSDAMGQPISHFFKEISDDLVKYSNVFIAKKRADAEKHPSMPGMKLRALGNKKPVISFTRLAPQTMYIKTDEHGTIEKYKQRLNGKEVEFAPEDIIHIAYKKPAGRFFGVPFTLPVLDDVRLLRKLEDNVSKLMHRHLYPLFVYQVGLEEAGKEADDAEIEDLMQRIETMPIDGGLVVPERHNVDLLTVDEDIGAEKFLEYFTKRVFTGLGVSETLMGRASTANRNTAENQSSEMRDKVKAIQTVLANYINQMIIRPLLMEAGFDPILNPEHHAEFEFNEIDIDLLIKQENHSIYKFEHNATTHDEMRQELGRETLDDEERKDLNGYLFNNVDINDTPDEGRNNYSEEGAGRKSLFIYNNKIDNLTVELKNEAITHINLFLNNAKTKRAAKEDLLKLTEMYLDKVKHYIALNYKYAFNKGVKKHIDEDVEPINFEQHAEENLKHVTEKATEAIPNIVESDDPTPAKLKAYVELTEKRLYNYSHKSIYKMYNIGQFKAHNKDGEKPVGYKTNNGFININSSTDLPDYPIILNELEEGGRAEE